MKKNKEATYISAVSDFNNINDEISNLNTKIYELVLQNEIIRLDELFESSEVSNIMSFLNCNNDAKKLLINDKYKEIIDENPEYVYFFIVFFLYKNKINDVDLLLRECGLDEIESILKNEDNEMSNDELKENPYFIAIQKTLITILFYKFDFNIFENSFIFSLFIKNRPNVIKFLYFETENSETKNFEIEILENHIKSSNKINQHRDHIDFFEYICNFFNKKQFFIKYLNKKLCELPKEIYNYVTLQENAKQDEMLKKLYKHLYKKFAKLELISKETALSEADVNQIKKNQIADKITDKAIIIDTLLKDLVFKTNFKIGVDILEILLLDKEIFDIRLNSSILNKINRQIDGIRYTLNYIKKENLAKEETKEALCESIIIKKFNTEKGINYKPIRMSGCKFPINEKESNKLLEFYCYLYNQIQKIKVIKDKATQKSIEVKKENDVKAVDKTPEKENDAKVAKKTPEKLNNQEENFKNTDHNGSLDQIIKSNDANVDQNFAIDKSNDEDKFPVTDEYNGNYKIDEDQKFLAEHQNLLG